LAVQKEIRVMALDWMKGLKPSRRKVVTMGVLAVFLAALCVGTTIPNGEVFGAKKKPKIARLKIRKRANLEFGTFASDVRYPGTVVIDVATGAKTVTGGVFNFGGASSRAEFRISGKPNSLIAVTIPSTIIVERRRSSATMTVRDVTWNHTNPVTLNDKGKVKIYVGGTLDVGAGQTAGRYKARFRISADYLD
jgi:hypothetical protein